MPQQVRTRVVWNNIKAFGPLRAAQVNLIREGLIIEGEVKQSMGQKQGGGKLYMIGKNRDIPHYASAANEPPAVLTGRLRASITTTWTNGPVPLGGPEARPEDAVGVPGGSDQTFIVVVGTNVDYAVFLELGTSRMAPRPFMRPVFERHQFALGKSKTKSISLKAPTQMLAEMALEIGGEFGSD